MNREKKNLKYVNLRFQVNGDLLHDFLSIALKSFMDKNKEKNKFKILEQFDIY